MKKVLALAAVLCVVCLAGTALAKSADNRKHHRPAPQRVERPMQPGKLLPCRPMPGNRRNFRPVFTPDMPREIREKAAELAKLRIDLEEAMTSRPLNKQKALDVHAKIQKVKMELDSWRFAKRLERLEARQKNFQNEPADPFNEAGEADEIPDVNPESNDVK